MDWLADHMQAAWLGAAILLVIAEMFSLDLFLAMLAVGALAGMGAAFATDSFALQAVAAVVVSIAMLAVVRPSLARRLHSGPDLKTGNDRVVGLLGTVTEAFVAPRSGRIALDGEVWTASADDGSSFRTGDRVEVVEIRGATAHVRAARPELDPE